MSKKEAIIDTGKFVLTSEYRDYIPSLGNREYGFILMIYRDEDGDFRRPLWQPTIEIYDADETELLYQGWPDPDGEFRARENGNPSEIFYTGDSPRMVWYGKAGIIEFVQYIKKEHLSKRFRSASAQYAAAGSWHFNQKPTAYETSIPSPLQAALE